MRLWQALLLALAAAGASGDKEAAEAVPLDAPQHRESRDSYVDAFQQNSYKPQKQQIDYSHSYPVYSAPVPSYGPSKEDHHEPAKSESGHYGVPHFHHHYTVPEAPHPLEHEPEKGHGGFDLSTVIQFLAKIVFFKLLIKKILLIMTLLIVPKLKLLSLLLKKKKKPHKPGKPDHHSSEEHDDDDMGIGLNFFRNSRGLDHLENRVVGAIEKQQEISTKA